MQNLNDLHDKTDQELVNMALINYQDYSYIIHRYERKLAAYIRRLINANKEDAEDILQEVFIKAFRYINSYNPELKFSSWIYRIAHNEAIGFYRKYHARKSLTFANLDDLINSETPGDDLETEAFRHFSNLEIRRILGELDEQSRTVLLLKYVEGQGYEEISDILHIPSGTVGSPINRAKQKFRVIMKKYERTN